MRPMESKRMNLSEKLKCSGVMLFTMSVMGLSQLVGAAEEAIDPDRAANTVILTKTAIENLRIKTEMVEEREFETTFFAVGRIEDIPSRHYSIASRIPGRAIEVNAYLGDEVKKGQILFKIESRQAGNPPPTITLEALADGVVVESHIRTGQPVEPDNDLLDVADRSEMWAVAKMPDREAAKVKPGTKARIYIPAAGGEPIVATLLRYGVSADRVSGTVEGVFLIPNPEGKLLPGMRAEFNVITASRPFVMAAPKSAIQGDPSKRVLYVKDFDLPNAFVRVPVVLGEVNDRYVEVKSGLFIGDDVVTQGSYSLGFVGAGSGMSLKDALDAAHGHEHNEDGSEISSEQKKSEDAHAGHDHGDEGHGAAGSLNKALLAYAVVATLLALFFFQRDMNRRRAAEGKA